MCNRICYIFLTSTFPIGPTEADTATDRLPSCHPTEQFSCPNGECIPIERRCDQRLDCYDGADESNCPVECPVYKCIGEEKCFDYAQKCDGNYDCQDGYDEQGCRKYIAIDG